MDLVSVEFQIIPTIIQITPSLASENLFKLAPKVFDVILVNL